MGTGQAPVAPRPRLAPPPPVLCYHRIGGPLELGVTRIAPAVFRRQLRALAERGWHTLTLAQFSAALTPGDDPIPVPRPGFLLTFDDGYAELAEHAYPVLAELGFTATTFLVTDFIGRENAWDVQYTWRRLRHLDWAAIDAWQDRGFDFGSHGATHRRLTWLSENSMAEDLRRARERLVARLGPAAGRAVAYPFGAVDERVLGAAAATGYSLGFGGVRGVPTHPLHLPRLPVYLWDVWSTPVGLQPGALGAAGRFVAHVANRCSVGTSWMLKMAGNRER